MGVRLEAKKHERQEGRCAQSERGDDGPVAGITHAGEEAQDCESEQEERGAVGVALAAQTSDNDTCVDHGEG